MQRLCLGPWSGPELVAEQAAEVVVDAGCGGDVPSSLERAHQEAVATLTVGLASDQSAPGSLGRGDLAPSDAEPGLTDALERIHLNRQQRSTPLLDPWRVMAGEKLAPRDVQRDSTADPGLRPIASCDSRL